MTRFERLIRKAAWEWKAWRMRRERERAMPELRDLRIRREKFARQHRKGAAAIEQQQRARMTAALGGR